MSESKKKVKIGVEGGFEGPLPIAKVKAEYELDLGSVEVQEGTYYIMNKLSGKVLDVNEWSKENGANVHQWDYTEGQNQQWRISHASNGYYNLIAVHSNKALDVDGKSTIDGANVHQWAFNGDDNEQWEFIIAGDGTYFIKAKHSGKVLDVDGWSQDNGANIHQWSCHGGDNQKWKLIKIFLGRMVT